MLEIWKDVKGYDGLYMVSNLGRVKSLNRECYNKDGKFMRSVPGKTLRPSLNPDGYEIVVLYKHGLRNGYSVHQLVAIAFLGHKPSGMKMVCDHINNVRNDNRSSNLQLITQRKNTSKDKLGGSSKYTGVSWGKITKKWHALIYINGKNKHLGFFADELDASNAYQNALAGITII